MIGFVLRHGSDLNAVECIQGFEVSILPPHVQSQPYYRVTPLREVLLNKVRSCAMETSLL